MRHHIVNGKKVGFTPEEETARDLEEQAWEDGSVRRNAKAKINQLEGEVTNRRLREAVAGNDAGWLSAQEAKIATERGKL